MSAPFLPLIIVTPVYEDLEASTQLFKELAIALPEKIFLVAVDDGSVGHPLSANSLRAAGVSGVVLKLRRNVGHQCAIAIGLAYVSERAMDAQRVIVMDSDGEDLPRTIPYLLEKLDHSGVDVVVAQRKSRYATPQFKGFYRIYKVLFHLMTGREISFGNFMALRMHSVRRLVSMQELRLHIAATILASRLRTGFCPLDRGARYSGQSKMSFVGLALHGFKGLMVFAEDVLVRVGIICVLVAGVSVLGIAIAVGLKILGFATPGWFSVALGILMLMLLQTGALALMTLMLTGLVRGRAVTSAVAYQDFIEAELQSGLGKIVDT